MKLVITDPLLFLNFYGKRLKNTHVKKIYTFLVVNNRLQAEQKRSKGTKDHLVIDKVMTKVVNSARKMKRH